MGTKDFIKELGVSANKALDHLPNGGCQLSTGGTFRAIKSDNSLTVSWGEDITALATKEGHGEEAFVLKEGEDSWRRISRPKRTGGEGWPKPFQDYTDEEMEQFLKDLKSKENMHAVCERRYKESGENPFFIWVTIKDCLSRGFPLPGFVNDYLLRSAEGVIGIPDERKGEKAERIAALLQPALGFESSKARGKDSFSQPELESRNTRIYFLMKLLELGDIHSGRKTSLEDKREIVSRKVALSSESIKKIYQTKRNRD